MTENELAALRRRAIGRAIDEETERRMARAGHHRPEPREPARTAAQTKELSAAAWNAWLDGRLRADFIPAVGDALARVRRDILGQTKAEIEAAKAAVGEQLSEQIADAVRDFVTGAISPIRVELEQTKARLAEAEARLAAFAADPRTAPLALPGRWVGTA